MVTDNIAIWVGIFAILVVIIVRLVKLKKKFIEKVELITSLGYFIFAYISAIAIVQMIKLVSLTLSNNLTIELIQQNREYVCLAWIIIAIGSFVAYISLLIEDKKKD